MGAEQSAASAGGGGSHGWDRLSVGLRLSRDDVAVWPQLQPLVLWFTEDDALALLARLHRRKRTRFLTLPEFHAWLRSDQQDTVEPATVGDQLPLDIMIPPAILHASSKPGYTSSSSNNNNKQPTLKVMSRVLDHVFATFAGGGKLLYAMEFLAAMVVASRAIWKREHKCRLLLTLFQDVAARQPQFKLPDLVQLFFCVLQGTAKVTVGLQRHWHSHNVDIQRVSRRLATDAFTYHGTTSSTKLTLHHVLSYMDATPSIARFVALFSGEELRNPSTFGDAVALPPAYRPAITRQREAYDALVSKVVSDDGRMARRRHAAALLIQSTWRRRCCQSLAERARVMHQRQRHASAATLQQFMRQHHVAKVLEQHAEAEALAANGGVFFSGHGACVPTVTATVNSTSTSTASSIPSIPSTPSTPSPLRLVDAFKLQGVKMCAVTMSKSCCVALQSDRQSLFVWGRCLPRVYADHPETVVLTQSSPARLSHRFSAQNPVVDIACGLSHALVLTRDGNVHSWGFNDHGQLGHGSAATLLARTNGKSHYSYHYDDRDGREYEFLPHPTTLVYFQGSPGQQAEPIPIKRVVCGDYFSLALSRDGDVFSWGEASEGQLGHGDSHARFQVALVDRHMLNSAYTFLAEPEPVLGLSDQRVVQVGCKKNHSVALTADGHVFEWGHWGKRLGHDQEHAFAPVEMECARPLGLRQLSVGDHHIVAEGNSVWLTIPGRVDGLRGPHSVYLAVSPAWSCPQDVIADRFCHPNKQWTCVVIDIDTDDITVDGTVDDGVDDDTTGADGSGDAHALWTKRAGIFALVDPSAVAAFDTRLAHVLRCFPGLARKFSYERMLMLWLHGHVQDRLVVMPRGKPPGCYLQILLPKEHGSNEQTAQEESEDDDSGERSPLVRMAEFPVVAATTCDNKITRTGFATHLFHAVMRERLALLPRRMRKALPVDFMEPNSVYILEFNENSLDDEVVPEEDNGSIEGRTEPEGMERFFTRSSTPDGKQSFAWSDVVVEAMARRVLAAQESGALAVLVVLDFLDADAFALELAPTSGVYIPVFMIKKSVVATRTLDGKALAFSALLEQFVASQSLEDEAFEDADEVPALPPAWITRCFLREDTTARRIHSAVANGAAGVILVQDAQSTEMDGETAGAPVFLDPPRIARTDRLVAMVSWQNGDALRAASSLSLTARAMPFVKSDDKCELVVDVGVEIRPGGSVYAWGNGQSGRLGVGNPSLPPLRDGYEALTDSSYRFIDRPTPIVALAGQELKQIVCGSGHTITVTQQGRVYTWGKGSKGELANTKTKDKPMQDQWVPRELHHLRYERIVAAAANDSATLLLSELVDASIYLERRKEIAQLRAVARKSVLL